MASGVGSESSFLSPLSPMKYFESDRQKVHKKIEYFLTNAASITYISKDSPLGQKLYACMDAYASYVKTKAIVKQSLAEKIATAEDLAKVDELINLQKNFKQQTKETSALFLQFAKTYPSLIKDEHFLCGALSKNPPAANTPELPHWPKLTHSSVKINNCLAIACSDKELWYPNKLRKHLLTVRTSLESAIRIRTTTQPHDGLTAEANSLYQFLENIQCSIHQQQLMHFLLPLVDYPEYFPHTLTHYFKDDLNQAFCVKDIKKLEECLAYVNSANVWESYPVQALSNLSAKGLDLIKTIRHYDRQTLHKTPIPTSIKCELRNHLIHLICTSPEHIQDAILQSLEKQTPRGLTALSKEWLEANLDQELNRLHVILKSVAILDQNDNCYRYL